MSDYCFVITGCTAGLGLALLERLISEYPSSHFIAICRNKPKAERVFKKLIEQLKKTDGRLDGKSIPRILIFCRFLEIFISCRFLENEDRSK